MESGIFQPLKMAVIGTGYVGLDDEGLPGLNVGHNAVGVDKDADKVCRLRKGQSPIHQMEELEITVAAKVSMSQLADVVRPDRETNAPVYEGIGRLLFICGRILYPTLSWRFASYAVQAGNDERGKDQNTRSDPILPNYR